MIPLTSTIASQISFRLQSLNSSNYDDVFHELCQYTSYGIEGSILLLQTCFDHLNVYADDLINVRNEPLVTSVFRYLLDKPNFGTVFCESLKCVAVHKGFLQELCSSLQLSTSEKIGVGLALSESENDDIRICGNDFLMGQMDELCGQHMPLDSAMQVQSILMFLHQSDGLSKHVDTFMQMFPPEESKDKAQFIFTPLLSNELREANFLRNLDMFDESTEGDFDDILEEMKNEMSMADIMKELGYGCTVHVSQCKDILSLFLPLTELTVAKILSTVARTYTGLEGNQSMFLTFHSALGSPNVPNVQASNCWNANVLVESIKQLAPETNWTHVVEKLDHEDFYIPSEEAFLFFMSVYRCACQEPFPLHTICGSVWENAEGQLSFLKYAVSVPPEVFTFAHSARQLAYVDAVNDHKFQNGHANHAWLCIDLLEVMCHLAERGHAGAVKLMLEYPLKHCPELLLLGMAHVKSPYNLLQNEVSSYIFPVVLQNPAGIGMIVHLWHVNPNLLLRGFVDAASVDHGCIPRILDACQELKILSTVLDVTPSVFSIRLAALASRRDLVDLENWLITNLNTFKDNFFEECVKLLKEVRIGTLGSPTKRFHPSGALWNIYMETSPTFLKVLQSHVGLISSSYLSAEVERLHVSFMSGNSKLNNGIGTDSSASDGYADDIEAEANSYFHKMFSGLLSVDALIQMLSRLKESSEKRDQSIFECMIANLFEEYKFFPKYPDTELRIAAILYGSLIKHRLVTDLTLGIALRAVLEALRKPTDSRMFVFGTRALQLFVDRLIEWPQYCNHIQQISHLRATQPELVAFIERALARISATHSQKDLGSNGSVDSHHASSQPSLTTAEGVSLTGSTGVQPSLQVSSPLNVPPRPHIQSDEKGLETSHNHMKSSIPSGAQSSVLTSSDAASVQKAQSALIGSTTPASSPAFVRSSRAITSARFGSALNIETLVAAADRREIPIEAPASEVQDKISFIINNLSAANIEAKAKEFIEVLKEQHYPWFAQYLVMKRASIEPNFHDLYLKFLDKVNSKALNKETVQTTYENCKVLLGSELIKSSSEERSLLKNLGSWLGKITIGRNQVLRAREIDPKALILQAYERGLMIAVIPFTSKVLEPCQSSLAYQPPNPWTMGILGLLAEIGAMPNLKMNLKFDIEMLFKNLGVDLKNVMPTSLLKDRIRQVDGNPDFSNKDVGAPQASVVGEAKSGIVPPVNQVELPTEVGGTSHPGGQSHILSQFPTPHLSSGTLVEDEKLAALELPDQLPSARNLLQGKSSFSLNQLSRPSSSNEQKFIINPQFQTLGLHLPFQSVLPIAMDRAIKEIVTNIVQRSVTISTKTTKELVLKDYAMETDDNHVHMAARLMVASLAGSLAHVTCKEQLRLAISGQLRNLLQGLKIDMLEQAIQLATNDNLDLGCALIEEAATDKAIQAIDVEIAQHLTLRRKLREGGGITYIDANLYTTGHLSVLPDALRPKPGRLSHSQQRVYEDFVRLPWQSHSGQNSNSVGPSASSSFVDLSRAFSSISGQINHGMYSSGPEKTCSDSVPQVLDAGSNEVEAYSSIQHHSAATIGFGKSEGSSPLSSEKVPDISLHSVAAPELLPVEPSDVKEVGSSIQPLNSTSAPEHAGIKSSEPLLTTGDVLDKYQMISEKIENLVASEAKESEIQGVVSEVSMIILRSISQDESALAVAQKVFEGLYENSSSSAHIKAHLSMLAAIRGVSKLIVKELTNWVIYSEEERKFNKDITVGLIQSELLNLDEYNLHMAKLLDAGRNKAATDFAAGLIQMVGINDVRVLSELQNLVDALAKVAARSGSPESLQQLVETAKNPAANIASLSSVSNGKEDMSLQSWETKATNVTASGKHNNSTSVSVEPDPVFYKQVSKLFAEWYRLCELPGANDAVYARFVVQLQQSGLLKGDDTTDRFFRHIMELSVSHCLSSEVIASGPSQSYQIQPLSFLAIDIYAKLSFAILKFYPVDLGSGKLSLLPKVLGLTVRFIQKEAQEKKTSFNPRPYFRLFINWLSDLCSLDPVSDGSNFQVLTAFSDAFHALQPSKVPGFSFAWLELVSHRSFMPKLLSGNAQKGWFHFQCLLVDLFQFMEPFLRNAELEEPVHFLYKGSLRVLLVLLHDFPEFLCDYHFSFCDVIPPSCIQMRNIVLSAFPRNMRLPDPSTPNLKIDLLDEISQSPHILSEIDGALIANQIKNDLDEYLKIRQQGSQFLSELKQKLLLSPSESSRAGTRYNVPLMNSLVLYVGMQAIPHAQSKASGGGGPLDGFLVGAALDIFQTLILDLDMEGRYLFLNAIANQLRYPNNHTHYFSFILLYLFSVSKQEVIEEQITRVLLERLIVDRPHPWGLLITFIELIKNTNYNFWSRSFTRCAPEIEKLFESVSRSCGGPKPVDEGAVSGGGMSDTLH